MLIPTLFSAFLGRLLEMLEQKEGEPPRLDSKGRGTGSYKLGALVLLPCGTQEGSWGCLGTLALIVTA